MFPANSTRFKEQFIFSAYIQEVSFTVSPRTAALSHGNPIPAGISCHSYSDYGHDNKNTLYIAGNACRVRERNEKVHHRELWAKSLRWGAAGRIILTLMSN
jgi:hypothetical protein